MHRVFSVVRLGSMAGSGLIKQEVGRHIYTYMHILYVYIYICIHVFKRAEDFTGQQADTVLTAVIVATTVLNLVTARARAQQKL